MAIIEPTRKDIEHPTDLKRHSLGLRIWHWLNLLVLSGSLLTVLLNATLLDVKSNTRYIQHLQGPGKPITADQAKNIAHGLEDNVWDIHIYLGYALLALLLFRFGSALFLPKRQQFFHTLKSAYLAYRKHSKQSTAALHELTVKALYLFFYVLLATMAITGLCMAFKDELGISSTMNHSIKEFHGFCMYLILIFMVIHVVGVVLAERKAGKGIVSDMINGWQI